MYDKRVEAESLGCKRLQHPRTHNRFPYLNPSDMVPPCPEQESKSIKLSRGMKSPSYRIPQSFRTLCLTSDRHSEGLQHRVRFVLPALHYA